MYVVCNECRQVGGRQAPEVVTQVQEVGEGSWGWNLELWKLGQQTCVVVGAPEEGSLLRGGRLLDECIDGYNKIE